ncbi:Double-stranded RNA-binding protein 4 [Ananas comosus]|uniref:Double-stranded RNA-binding protein 4 n=1 Tax=Ananas comosus TaxID=4615 RepID=A0A199UFQ3_ANACO|nr:Double-stranded RNA-binding protein 4 [Ananas comosus]
MEVAARSTPEQFKYKNRLQEYAQKSSIPLPQYQTVNEGYQHAPQFRATVYIGGEVFKSPHTFAHRKEAEQDVAKFALENLSRKIKPVEDIPQINPQIYQLAFCNALQNAVFCKSILHEYTVKAHAEKPMYSTSRSEGQLPLIIGSVVLDGKTYKGDPARNKKEAEQTAARAAIKSILENTSTSNLMAKIIQSKAQFYSALCRYIVPTSSEGSEVQAILGGSGLVGVTNSQEMPIGPVGQSLPLVNNILKKEYTYNQGSAANADAQLASLAQTGSTLIAFESSGEYYHPQGDQVTSRNTTHHRTTKCDEKVHLLGVSFEAPMY